MMSVTLDSIVTMIVVVISMYACLARYWWVVMLDCESDRAVVWSAVFMLDNSLVSHQTRLIDSEGVNITR